MKRILLTNNTELINLDNNNYDLVYTDSPYVVEHYSNAIYLDTLLDESLEEIVNNIRKKGYEINKNIIETFFPQYKNRSIDILNIKIEFSNIFINTIKLIKLINLYPNDEITIGVTNDELYNYDSPEIIEGLANRFVNIYFWIVDIANLKNIKLICKKTKKKDPLIIKKKLNGINNMELITLF